VSEAKSSTPSAWPLGLVTFASAAYFVQGAGANQNSRFDLVRAIVESGRFDIDAFRGNTIDFALHEGHYYSDKAPGLSLLALPSYAIGDGFGPFPRGVEPHPWVLHFVTLATVGLASALAAVALAWLCQHVGVGRRLALAVGALWIVGTNALAYSGLFYAHQLSGSLLVLGLCALKLAEMADGKRAFRFAVASGFCLAHAVVSEFPVALAAAPVGLLLVKHSRRRLRAPFALGAALPLALLGLYNLVCFGNPFRLGYSALAPGRFRDEMSRGLFGIAWPDPRVAFELLLGEYRGLLWISPMLLLAVPGFRSLYRSHREIALVGLAATTALFLAICGYGVWDGGAAFGPRHLIPILPFVMLGVARELESVWHERSRYGSVQRVLATTLVVVSIGASTLGAAVMPELPEKLVVAPVPGMAVPDMRAPLRSFALPLFLRGHVSEKATQNGRIALVSRTSGHEWDAFNLGERVGLPGPWSLLPLLGAWALFLVWLFRRPASASGGNRRH
jgi:hypothetical protein